MSSNQAAHTTTINQFRTIPNALTHQQNPTAVAKLLLLWALLLQIMDLEQHLAIWCRIARCLEYKSSKDNDQGRVMS